MRKRQLFQAVIPFVLCAFLTPSVFANIYTVTSNADAGAGTMRQAMTDAMLHVGKDTIRFNIAGAGLHTITLLSPLPLVEEDLVIDGYSQPGSSKGNINTCQAHNALIQLDGVNQSFNGINVDGSLSASVINAWISGLYLTGFDHAVLIRDNARVSAFCNVISGNKKGTHAFGDNRTDFFVYDNYFGTTVSSTTTAYGGSEIAISFCAADTIEAYNNQIAFSTVEGLNIFLVNSAKILIHNNLIGTNCSKTADLGNLKGANIVDLDTGCALFEQNTFAYNDGAGIDNSDGEICVRKNSFYLNDGAGITTFLNTLTATPNITAASLSNSMLSITLSAPANATIELFLADQGTGDASGGEGKTYLTTLTKDATATSETFSINLASLPFCLNNTMKLTATASDAAASCGCSTSLFSNNIAVTGSSACVQVGNYVWYDQNRDGVQNLTESPLSNIALSLWKAGNQIASMTTNASGEYYFLNKNAVGVTWTGTGADTTLLPNTAYQIRIDTTNQTQLDTLKLTIADATTNGGNDQNDSDASITGNYAIIDVTTDGNGSSNHSYDFGFYRSCDTTLVVANATICNGSSINLFAQASSVSGILTYSTDGINWLALNNPTNLTPSVSTTYFVKDSLIFGCFDVDTLQITVNQPVTAGTGTNPSAVCQAGSNLSNIDLFTQLAGETSGGIWSQTNGTAVNSALNTMTGALNINGLAAGSYVFRYSVTAVSPCANDTEDITITIQNCCPATICLPATIAKF
jgi:SdrD B-like domain